MGLSHRARLTLATSLAAGLLLACVLFGWYWYSSSTEFDTAQKTLKAGLAQLVLDLQVPPHMPDIQEVHAGYPNVTFAYFKGTDMVDQAGALPVYPEEGFARRDEVDRVLLTDGHLEKNILLTATLDWSSNERALRRLATIFIVLWLIMVGLVAAVSWIAADATFKPLHRLTRQAAQMSGTDLSARLSPEGKAEFTSFTKELNSMLERIQTTAAREEQFAADAAHELRTPLAIMRTKLEASLLKTRSPEDYRTIVASLLPEVDRLTRLVDMLLRTARAGHSEASCLDFSAEVEQAAARWLDRYESAGVHLNVEAEPAHACIRSEEIDLLCDNFLHNALRYSPRGSECSLRVGVLDSKVFLRVRDQGPGVPPEMTEAIFDRFRRADEGRGRSEGGYGIGLSVCKTIVTARGGSIRVENKNPGAEFIVELPSCELSSRATL